MAGFTLAVYAASASLPGLWPDRASFRLPALSAGSDPAGNGAMLAAGIVMVLAAARRLLPARWAPPAAALAGALLFGPIQVHPYPFDLAANIAVASLLVLLVRRGGLTGDVVGHGYSCAIVQAMTTAALTSLISPEKTPAEVLRRVDRVIRRGASSKTSRNFTTLALLRLDPETGEVLLSNAGHPSPFLLLPGGEVTEIELPGLPLGQGPARTYRDHGFHLPPGSALVFCSDGLFEGRDAREEQYGYERPIEVLRGAAGASASGLLETVLGDWRRHLGGEELPDDTTVVVIKRMSA